MELTVLPGTWAVSRLPPASPIPPLVAGAPFVSITRTEEELSLVTRDEERPAGATSERGFALLKVEGPIPFGQVGVLRALAEPLARAGISLFASSTYDTDYLLLREEELSAALVALLGGGHRLRWAHDAVAHARIGSAVSAAGFAVVTGVLGGGACDDVLAAIAEWSGARPGARTRAGARGLLGCAGVATLAMSAPLASLASAALGASARPLRATLFEKGAGARWWVSWHQDTVLPAPDPLPPGWSAPTVKAGVVCARAPADALARVVAIRLHLDDVGEDAGALRVLPSTHRQGVLGAAEVAELATRIGAVPCHAPRGSVVVISPLLVHASSRPRGSGLRRILHMEYAAARPDVSATR